jgi:isoamylase
MKVLPGFCEPLGLTRKKGGVNFALFSQEAPSVTLCLFTSAKKLYAEVPMQGPTHSVWHVELRNVPDHLMYLYRIGDHLLSDPYARSCFCAPQWGIREQKEPLYCHIDPLPPFDWQGVRPPSISLEELIIYEMHVRGFTKDPSSRVKYPGTYLGVIEKIPYLQSLGVTAVELMPVYEFDETDHHKINPTTGERLLNYWGYSPISFFLPMSRYASDSTRAIIEFKMMVRELHRVGIEVILDVVYNHTGESKKHPVSFRGIDKHAYYLFDEHGGDRNFSGCGNTFNTNSPAGMQVILDSMHWWVREMHIDGFRFDLASVFSRGTNGELLADPPILKAMAHDPILSRCKFIAEAWDVGGLYQLSQFTRWGPFLTWNGMYRDHVRKFIKGTPGLAGFFATALCGSQPLYPLPLSSINFITAHDGYSLRDLVSYQEKHNLANGEENRDGNNANESWNCGAEGVTSDPAILALRERQMRNFQLVLLFSQGIPMILMGDEFAHTRMGNNNPYNQDNKLNWITWPDSTRSFLAALIAFRKANPVLRRTKFLTPMEIEWHGQIPHQPDWSDESRLVAFALAHLYVAFNANHHSVQLTLPPGIWHLVVQTDRVEHYLEAPTKGPILSDTVELVPYSSLVAYHNSVPLH